MRTAVVDHWGLGIGKPFGVKELRGLRFKLPNTTPPGRPDEGTAFTPSWRYRTRSRSQPTKGVWMAQAFADLSARSRLPPQPVRDRRVTLNLTAASGG